MADEAAEALVSVAVDWGCDQSEHFRFVLVT